MSFSNAYLSRFSSVIESMDRAQLDSGIAAVTAAWRGRRQVITLGNGGSAMTALHFVTDWGKMVHLATGQGLRCRSLVENMGLVTAYANDMSYADVFVEQLKVVADPGDLVIAISGSGNSENVVRAIDYADEVGCETLGLCGFSGGRLRERAKNVVWVNSNDMQLCEDAHSIFGHMVMQSLCAERTPSLAECFVS